MFFFFQSIWRFPRRLLVISPFFASSTPPHRSWMTWHFLCSSVGAISPEKSGLHKSIFVTTNISQQITRNTSFSENVAYSLFSREFRSRNIRTSSLPGSIATVSTPTLTSPSGQCRKHGNIVWSGQSTGFIIIFRTRNIFFTISSKRFRTFRAMTSSGRARRAGCRNSFLPPASGCPRPADCPTPTTAAPRGRSRTTCRARAGRGCSPFNMGFPNFPKIVATAGHLSRQFSKPVGFSDLFHLSDGQILLFLVIFFWNLSI